MNFIFIKQGGKKAFRVAISLCCLTLWLSSSLLISACKIKLFSNTQHCFCMLTASWLGIDLFLYQYRLFLHVSQQYWNTLAITTVLSTSINYKIVSMSLFFFLSKINKIMIFGRVGVGSIFFFFSFLFVKTWRTRS